MHEPRPRFGLRDLVYLVAVCLVLALWGWDRGRLAARLLTPPAGRQAPQYRRLYTLSSDGGAITRVEAMPERGPSFEVPIQTPEDRLRRTIVDEPGVDR